MQGQVQLAIIILIIEPFLPAALTSLPATPICMRLQREGLEVARK